MRDSWELAIARWRRRWADRRFKPETLVRGRYKILRTLGEGSYGVAYLCQDANYGNRLCVLKRMQPLRGGRKRTRSMYSLEVHMLASLNHIAIPKLYESFRYYGYYCFTMEYAEGVSLETLLFEQEKVFTELESLSLISRLLEVVAYVHSQGIVHRDLRIANVIIHDRSIRLIDFGLARRFSGAQDMPPADDVFDDDPMEKLIRRRLHPTGDFYALGHLLLFLLYSAYPAAGEEEDQDVVQGWETELSGIHPHTRRLLHRLLLVEQPYGNVAEVQDDVAEAISALQTEVFEPLYS
jgi:serine/threonine protein kinase, bacterial